MGYKWFDREGHEPLFPFGHGLSYTRFSLDHLVATREGDGIIAMVEVTNEGDRAGAEVVQLYVSGQGWDAPRRLGGFAKVELAPGETKRAEIHVDPRLLATWFAGRPGWTHPAGAYTVSVGHSSRELAQSVIVELPPSFLPQEWKPAQPVAGVFALSPGTVKPWDWERDCGWWLSADDGNSLRASIGPGDGALVLTLADPAFLAWPENEFQRFEVIFSGDTGGSPGHRRLGQPRR